MQKFNLVKSLTRVINNRKGLLILCLSLATIGVNEAWGAYRTTVYVNSSPTTGGYVYIGKSSDCGESSCTKISDDAVQGKDGFKTSGSFTWYFCHKTNANYIFKGWTTNQNANSGDGASSNPWVKSLDATMSASSITGGNSYTYYALFARMTGSIGSGTPISFGKVLVGSESAQKTITLTHLRAGTITLTVPDGFSVSPATITSEPTVEHEETITITVVNKGAHSGKLTIRSNNGLTELTYPLSATGLVRPEIVWVDGDEQTIEGGASLNPGDLLRATCLTSSIDKYTFDEKYFNQITDEDNITYLQVREDIIATGSIATNLTAHVPEAAEAYVAEGESTIGVNITNKTRLQIEWTDNISDLDNSEKVFPYTMPMHLTIKTRSGETITGKTIKYEVTPNTDYVDISGTTLTIKGAGGPTTIRAYVDEDDSYSAASTTKTVMVYNLGDVCDKEIGPYSCKLERGANDYQIPEQIKVAGTLTFNFSRKTAQKTLTVTEYSATRTVLHETKYDYNETGDKTINLQTNTAYINFNAPITGLTGQHFQISNIKVTRRTSAKVTMDATDITGKTEKWKLSNVRPFDVSTKSLTIDYSNRMVCAKFKTGNQGWTVDKKVIGKCGEEGSGVLTLSFSSTTPNNYSDTLILFDTDGTYATINLSASVTKPAQILDTWNLQETYNTTDKQTLLAKTTLNKTDFTFSVVSSSPANIVNIDTDGVITFSGAGTAKINAHIDGDDVYQELNNERNITISPVTPTIVTLPTATATITYGQYLQSVGLNGGAAKVNPFRGEAVDHAVEGSFAWTNGEYVVVEAGGTHEYDVTFTPSGTEAGMYNTVSGKATVTVNKATPTLTAKNEEDLEVYVNDTQTPKLNLVDYITDYSAESDTHGHAQTKSAITYACSQDGAVIEGNKFYATKAGTYTITATAPATDYYNSQTTTFTIKANNYYYSQAKSIVATNTITGKDGGWASVWQGNQDSASIGEGSWLHEDKTSNPKKLAETTHPYYFRAKVGTGYTFAGWFTSADAAEAEYKEPTYNGNFTISSREKTNPTWITRYAKFSPITYTVKFVGNGNTGGSMSDQTLTYDVAQNLTANAFVRTGWSFTGWKDGDNTYTNGQEVTNLASSQGATITMTAQWSQDTYTVTLDPNGCGTGGTTQIEVHYNELMPASITPPTPNDPAYMFLGYYLDVTDESTKYYNADGTAVSEKKWLFTEGKTLKAKWATGDYIKSWDVAESYTAQSNIPYDIAKSFSGAPVSYSIEGTDEGVITINNESKYIYANKKGTVTIKACPVHTDGYSSVSCDTHEITVVGKKQIIEWNQNFSFMAASDGNIDAYSSSLQAVSKDSLGTPTGITITYTSSNENVAKVESDGQGGWRLHVVGYGTDGTCTITAAAEGTTIYEPTSTLKTIRIVREGDKCYTTVLNHSGDKSFNRDNDAVFNLTNAPIPCDSVSVSVRKSIGTINKKFSAYLVAEDDTHISLTTGEEPGTSSHTYKWGISNDVPTRKYKRLVLTTEATFSYIVKSAIVTQRSYMIPSISYNEETKNYPINSTVSIGETWNTTFKIDYSNLQPILYSIENDNEKAFVLTPDREIDNTCGDVGSYTFTLKTTKTWWIDKTITATIKIYTSSGDQVVIPVSIHYTLGNQYQLAKKGDLSEELNWEDLSNWWLRDGTHPETLPTMKNPVQILNPVRINTPVEAYGIETGESAPGKVRITIAPEGGLTIFTGGIKGFNYDNTNNYSRLVIESSKNHQGYFRITPDVSMSITGMPIGTVQLATRSTLDDGANDDAVWQYIGVPVVEHDYWEGTDKDDIPFTVDYSTWLYEWSEPNGWVDMKNVSQPVRLKPFTGYAITQYGQPTYEFTGRFLHNNVRIPLTYTESGMSGDNVIANSYAAPIDVTLVDQTDFEGNVIQAFYVFNSGSWNQWKQNNTGNGVQAGSLANYTPGQYIAIPTSSGAELGEDELTMIAPMQGFDIYTTEKGKTAYFNLNYRKHVWNATNALGQMNEPVRAPKTEEAFMPSDVARQYAIWDSINAAKKARIDAITHRVRLIAYGENSGNDRVIVLESPLYAKQYENGADAPKMFAETEGLLGLYTNEVDCGLMSVNATNSVDGMFVGFRAGADNQYVLSASNVIGKALQLVDMETMQTIELKDSAQFVFAAEPYSQNDFRFQIVNPELHGGEQPTGWNGLGEQTKIWYSKQIIYISNASVHCVAEVFTAAGELIKQVIFNNNTTISTEDMPEGVYAVRVEGSVLKFFVKH